LRTPPVPRRRGPGLRDGAAAKAESQAAPRIAFVLFATPNGRWRRVLSGGGFVSASSSNCLLWFPQIPIILIDWELSRIIRLPLGYLFTALIASLSASFRSRAALQLEILALRHQLGVLQRSVKRSKLTPADRLLCAWLRRVWQDWQSGVFVMKAATILGSHRKGFRLFWRWKIRHGKPGRPAVPKEIRELIRI
jgi:hypothetical protein